MNREQEKIIEALFLDLYPFLVKYADSVLNNFALAEEAVQETFAVACRRADVVCESENPKGWLVETLKLIIRNTERRQISANKVISSFAEYSPILAAAPADHIDLTALYGNIANTKEFKLMYAVAIEGHPFLEISQKEGISVATCRKRFERARKYLQKKIR